MKKMISWLLILTCMVLPMTSFAAGKLSIVQEDFHVIESYSTYAHAYAKVENIGDKPIKVNVGLLEVYDENGDVITSEDYMSSPAEYLAAGEYTYVAIDTQIEEDMVADDYLFTVSGKSDKSQTTRRFPVKTDYAENVSNGYWENDYMYVEVTNDTDEICYDLSVVATLLDAEGKILYYATDALYTDKGLTPDSSMVFRFDVSDAYKEYFEKNSLVPATVDAIAYVYESNE